jgi:hypothetical protein
MNENDQIVILLKDIQHTLKKQTEESAFRWRVAICVVIVSLIIAAPAILSYVFNMLDLVL